MKMCASPDECVFLSGMAATRRAAAGATDCRMRLIRGALRSRILRPAVFTRRSGVRSIAAKSIAMFHGKQQSIDIDHRLGRALEFHQAGNLASAQLLYGQILADQPRQFEALHLLGLVRYQ